MGVKITDTTLRDAHQSLLATRMRPLVCHSERRPRSCGAMMISAKHALSEAEGESGVGRTAVLVAHRARTTNMETDKPWA